jgi:hypothetical protein
VSTSLDVFPGTDVVPAVGGLLACAEPEISSLLARLGIRREVRLRAQLGRLDDPRRWSDPDLQPLDASAPFWCAEDEYVHLSADGVSGGADVFVFDHREDDEEPHPLQDAPRSHTIGDLNRRTKLWTSWTFGNPATLVPSYHMLAGCLARLTDGLLYSADRGWEFSQVPLRPEELFAHYSEPHVPDLLGIAESLGVGSLELERGVHRFEYGDADRLAADCAGAGWRVFRLPQGMTSVEAFFDAASRELPLDPSQPGDWDELAGALHRALRATGEKRVAIVWQGALKLELEAYADWHAAIGALDRAVTLLAAEDPPRRLLVLLVPRRRGKP